MTGADVHEGNDRDAGAPGHVELLVHNGAHEVALEPLMAFLENHLRPKH